MNPIQLRAEDPAAPECVVLMKERRAMDVYQARGYTRIANYGKYIGNPLAVCFEKSLPPAREDA